MRQNSPLRAPGVIQVIPPPTGGSLGGATPTGPAASGALISFGPSVIPMSAPEIQNPTRGLFDWNEVSRNMNQSSDAGLSYYPQVAPVPEPPAAIQPMRDIYGRDQDGCNWRYMEPSPGVYNLDWLDQRAAAAQARGGRYGFRIMTSGAGGSGWANTYNNNVMPPWMQNDMGTYGGFIDSNGHYVPDTNNTNYLNKLVALWTAIGNRFGAGRSGGPDLRFGMMDIGMYGPAGEWWTPGGYPLPTTAHGKIIVDAHVDNMPQCDFVALPGDGAVADITTYAMSKRSSLGKYVGLRGDSWCAAGQWYYTLQSDYWTRSGSMAPTQWQRAPLVGECANVYAYGTWQGGDANVMSTGLSQVKDSHISMVGNGNFNSPFSQFNSANQQAWIDSGKYAGYRLQLNNLTIPRQIEAGSHATITATWQNVGVAPPYQSWNPVYSLRTAAGQLVWTGTSTRDFKFMLPSGPSVGNENFNFPASLPPGVMTLSVRVVDPTGYFQPLALANAGRTASGDYPLGTIVTA